MLKKKKFPFFLCRDNHEFLTFDPSEVDLQSLLDGGVYVVLYGVLTEEDLDWEGTTRDGVHRDVTEEVGKLVGIHGG